MNAERKEEAIFFEELHGAYEIADFDDLVNSPQPNSSEFADKIIHTLATKNIQSIRNPKLLTLTVLVGNIFPGRFFV